MLNHLRKIHSKEAKVADKKWKHNECSGTEKTVQLLSSFEEIIKEASNITSTISMIIPTIFYWW